MTPATSSSDSEDDEERQKLCQALDPDFLKRTTPQFEKSCDNRTNDKSISNDVDKGAPVSKRSKLFDTIADCNDFAKPYSLDVTPECQNFIAKQLGKSLDRVIKEVSPPIQPTAECTDTGIKLFASSKSHVTEEDLVSKFKSQKKPSKRKRKKRKLSKDQGTTDSSSESENEKLKSVAVTADWVLNSL